MNAQQKHDAKEATRIKRLTERCYSDSYDDTAVIAGRVALNKVVDTGATEDAIDKARWKLKDAIIKVSWKNGTLKGSKENDLGKIFQQIARPK